MNLPASLRIGLRYSNSRKSNRFIGFINTFSITGIALGLMALIITTSVMNGFEGQLKSRILGIMPHFVVAQSHWQVPPSLQNHVVGQAPFAEVEAVLQSPEALKPIYLSGVFPDSFQQYSPLETQMMQGSVNQLQQGQYNIIVGRMLALNQNLAIGDEVRIILAGKSIYTPFGRVPAQRKFTISGVFESGSELDSSVAFAHLADLAAVYRENVDELSHSRLFLADPFHYQEVRRALDKEQILYSDWRARQGPLFDAVKMEKNMMAIMLMLIIAVAAFNIISSLVMVVNEKQADIAILRTQGMTKYQVLQIFLTNGMANGIKGTLLGLFAGVLIATQLNGIIGLLDLPIAAYLPEGILPIDLRFAQVMGITGLSLGLCLLAAVYPAWQALKVEPAAALRDE
ncbi:MAG: lipoprotein-releasing ABC transporter permease subunit [Aestuariibacter sp.]